MPIGGKLLLKGGIPLKGVEKKKKKKKKQDAGEGEGEDAGPPGAEKKVDANAINVMSGNTYEKEFDLEMKRVQEAKTRSTPWGSSYRAPPEVLHGYSHKVTGKTASERLDMRAAAKADKFAK